MDLLSLLLLAAGLSMDAFAISVCKGLSMRSLSAGKSTIAGLYFGGAQMLMPIIGYFLGVGFRDLIEAYDHWVAFGLLIFIGGKMLIDALREKDDEAVADGDFSFKGMFPMAIATSIDALAVGISFSVLSVNIWFASSLIGIVTFIFCFGGVAVGCFFGSRFRKPASIAGGIILCGIGIKILLEHLSN